jgi:uncharacterized repeat protein (TIGR01451 family)
MSTAGTGALPSAGQMVPLPVVQNRVGAIDETKLVTLPGHVNPLARAEFDQGLVDDSLPVEHLIVVLQRSAEQDAAATVLVDQLHNRHSPQYHQWLTPQDFGKHFGPSDSDLQKLTDWLQGKGFVIEDVPPGRTHVTITGTAGQVHEAFHTQLHNLNVNGEKHIAVLTEPQVPAALAPLIAGFRQLHDWRPKPLYRPAGVFKRDSKTGGWQKVSGPGSAPELNINYEGSEFYAVGPQDWYTIYNSRPLYEAGINGAGTTIAVLEETDVKDPGDVTTFRSQFALPAYPATPNSTQGGVNWVYGPGNGCSDPGVLSDGEETEALLDVEWAGAIAPNATVDFVACSPPVNGNGIGSYGTDLAASYAANYLSSTVVATDLSYGECESFAGPSGAQFYSKLWQQMAAEGITAVVSSGDAGSLGCDQDRSYATNNLSANAMSSSPYNISAGGTDFSDFYQSGGYATESAGTWWGTTNGVGYGSALSYVPEISWGGMCSNPLLASYLKYMGDTTFGATYTPLAICNSAAAGPNNYDDLVVPVGGGGGISQYNALPSWQGGVYGFGNAAASTSYRNEPDLSFFAAPGWLWPHFLLYCQSDSGYSCDYSNSTDVVALAAGGTSFVAPQIAGMMALVNQETGARQGVADYTLYNLASAEYGTPGNPNSANLSNCSGSAMGAAVGSACVFRDIANDTPNLQGGAIISDNVEPCATAYVTDCYAPDGEIFGLSAIADSNGRALAYQTAPGYDLATGLGSADVKNLVTEWNTGATFASATSLTASPNFVIGPNGTSSVTASVVATGRGGQVAPVGTVSFYLGSTTGTLLGTTNLSSTCSGAGGHRTCTGTASLTITSSQLSPGANSIVAYFCGDGANDAPSTSSAVTVTYAPTYLTIAKSHAGNYFVQGQAGASYTLTVTNGGSTSSGTVAVTDTLPGALTATALSGAGWSCALSSVTCTRSDALNSLSSYPAITLTANVAANAPASLTNTATVYGNFIPGSNSASDVATVLLPGPDLIISKSHTGNFVQGQTGTYALTVSNLGGAASSGVVTVSDTLPAGLTAAAMSGPGWSCALGTVSCTRSDALNPLSSYPAITLTVSVADDAPALATNTAAVSGGGDVNLTNNSASDATTILPPLAAAAITTVAGNGTGGYGGDDGPATSAELDDPVGVAIDGPGNLYIADIENSRIRKVDAETKTITTVAGNGTAGYSGDGGPATSAELDDPAGVAVDGAGNLYIADTANNRIREVDAETKTITTVAGNGISGDSGDGGPATSAELFSPEAVAVDVAGNLYIADAGNNLVRKVDAGTGAITTVAGNGIGGYSGDGAPATTAELNSPSGVTVDLSGNFFIADSGNNRIRQVAASDGSITTIAGNGTGGFSGDGGPATSAELNSPNAVTVDLSGNLFIADSGNNRIRQMSVSVANGVIATVAGNGTSALTFIGDGGPATQASLGQPHGVAIDSAGNVYIADTNHQRIREVVVTNGARASTTTTLSFSPSSPPPASPVTFAATVSVVAPGTGTPTGFVTFYDGSIALGSVPLTAGAAAYTSSSLALGTHSIAASYWGDYNNLPSNSTPQSVTVAGSAPVPVVTSLLPSDAGAGGPPFALTVIGSNFVPPSAGLAGSTVLWNGSSRSTTFLSSTRLQAEIMAADLAAAESATVTVSNPAPGGGVSNGLVFAIEAAPCPLLTSLVPSTGYVGSGGLILTVEGTNFVSDSTVLWNGTSRATTVNSSAQLQATITAADVATAGTATVTVYTPAPGGGVSNGLTFDIAPVALITTVAGMDRWGHGGDGGPATSAKFAYPAGVAADGAGNLYIADSDNNVIREVSVVTGEITRVAGDGTMGYSGDGGAATQARLQTPGGVAADADGNLYIADTNNSVIREVSAATGIITTLAGDGNCNYSGDGGPASSAELCYPAAVALDAVGDLYIADTGYNVIREIKRGTITTVAGNRWCYYWGDGGLATNASMCNPQGVAVDMSGNIYIADTWNNVIRKVTVNTGIITTIAGNVITYWDCGYSGDGGAATSAELCNPESLALDGNGNIYIADTSNNVVRAVNGATRIISTVVGNGTGGYAGDGGPATGAELNAPEGVALDAAGNLYIADTWNNSVREVAEITAASARRSTVTALTSNANPALPGWPLNLTASVTTTGTGAPLGFVIFYDGSTPLGSAALSGSLAVYAASGLAAGTHSITAAYSGDLYNRPNVSAALSQVIAASLPAPVVLSLSPASAGAGARGFTLTVDGSGFVPSGSGWTGSVVQWNGNSRSTTFLSSTRLQAEITAADVATVGSATITVYTPPPGGGVSNWLTFSVQVIAYIQTVAGDGAAGYGGDGGPATAAELSYPGAAAMDAAGNLYIADAINCRVWKVSAADGTITTVAGNGICAYADGGGPATDAQLRYPEGVATDGNGNLYIADTWSNVVREVSVGIITTVAGNGTPGYSGDGGQANQAELFHPVAVAVDGNGNLFIADSGNCVVRKVSAGIITTVAGSGDVCGFGGDGGPATAAWLSWPGGIAVDLAGNLYIADAGNNRVREVSAGLITTVAGSGTPGFRGDGGPAISAALCSPEGVAVDLARNLYIADAGNSVIREVKGRTITTVAGDATAGYSGDGGPATTAELNYPKGVAVDTAGNLYVADTNNSRIREVVDAAANSTRAATATVLTSDTTSAAPDFPVTFMATVNAAQGSPAPVGFVTFYDGSSLLGSVVLTAGAASYTTSGLALGTNSITAAYSGDPNNLPSTSAAVTETITGGAPLPELTSLVPSTGYVGSGGLILTVEGTNFVSDSTVLWNGTSRATTVNSSAQLQATITAADVATAGTATVTVYTPAPGGGVSNGLTFDIAPVALITTVAGMDRWGHGGDGGPATSAKFAYPAGVAADGAGNLYIADSDNNVIREVSVVTGEITRVAGNGTAGYTENNGPATSIQLYLPQAVAVDAAGDLYIADMEYSFVREVQGGMLTTVAGDSNCNYSGDGGPASSAELCNPSGVAVDGDGNLYIADTNNNVIREVSATTGEITTVAGGGQGYAGDGVPATSVWLSQPQGVAVDAAGNLYIADTQDSVIREVYEGGTTSGMLCAALVYEAGQNNPVLNNGVCTDSQSNVYTPVAGDIYAVAGNGNWGYSGDGGPATSAELNNPESVAVDENGNIYIADTSNNVVRGVNGTTGIMSTVVGNGTGGYDGDGGPATGAELNTPEGVALDAAGNLYIADTWNNSVREVALAAANPMRAATTAALTSSANPAMQNTTATFTATVTTTGSTTPAGFVIFYDDSAGVSSVPVSRGAAHWGSAPVSSSAATYTTTNLAVGTHSITAAYSGDLNNLPSTAPALSETILALASVPVLTSLSPSSAYVGSGAFTLTAYGTNFVQPSSGYPGSVVLWNGNSEATTVVNSTELETTITDTFIAGTATVTVYTPPPGGGVSNGLAFTVQNPVPVLTSLSPSSASVGSGAFSLTVNGSGFVSGSTVLWNGTSRATTVNSSAQLQATIAAADVATAGTATVTVSAPGCGTSNALTFNIQAIIQTVAGGGANWPGDGGPATEAELGGVNNLMGVAVDTAGNFYFTSREVVLEVYAQTGLIATVAGMAQYNCEWMGDGGPATGATLCDPAGVAVDSAGNLYFAEMTNSVVRRVDAATGIITTVVGNGTAGYSGDGGPATEAELLVPTDVAFDTSGNMYIADNSNEVVREVSATTGIITTVAGDGDENYYGDGGPATAAGIGPVGVAVDTSGNLYVADSDNLIREVYEGGATSGMLCAALVHEAGQNNPVLTNGVCMDAQSNVYTPVAGDIYTVAGNGNYGYGGDGGPAASAELGHPTGVAVDAAGNLYVADNWNNCIRQVDAATGVISTIAGNGTAGYSGDGGPATAAEMVQPWGVALDAAGNLYVTDGTARVREVVRTVASY